MQSHHVQTPIITNTRIQTIQLLILLFADPNKNALPFIVSLSSLDASAKPFDQHLCVGVVTLFVVLLH